MHFNKFNFNKRRLRASNFYSFGKSSCRAAVTPRALGSLSYPFYQNQVAFSSDSTKALKATIKIHFRTFNCARSCWKFRKKLKKKFKSFSDKKLKIFRNIRGNKIRYFCIEKNKIEGIK